MSLLPGLKKERENPTIFQETIKCFFGNRKSQRIRVITLCHCTHYELGTHAIVVQIFIFLCNSCLKLLKICSEAESSSLLPESVVYACQNSLLRMKL